jgi:hypothetical protein
MENLSKYAIYLAYGSFFSVAIPLFFLLLKGKQNLRIPLLRALLILLIAAMFFDSTSYILSKMHRSSIVVVNSYFIMQFFCLSYIYYLILKNRLLIYITSVLFTGFTIINTLFIQPFTKLQGYSDALQSVIFIIYGIVCYLQMIKSPFEDEVIHNLALWIMLGTLYYFFMNLYLFVSSTYIFTYQSADTAMIFWGFHNFSNIVKNIFFAAGIYYAGKKAVSRV